MHSRLQAFGERVAGKFISEVRPGYRASFLGGAGLLQKLGTGQYNDARDINELATFVYILHQLFSYKDVMPHVCF